MLITELSQLSVPMLILLGIIMIWEAVWKLMAMWKAANKGSVAWFIALAIFNTVGILPILYIYFFSERKQKTSRKKRR